MYLSIGQRIVLGFGLVLTLMIGLGIYELSSMTGMRREADGMVDADLVAAQAMSRIRNGEQRMRAHAERAWVNYFLDNQGSSDKAAVRSQQEWDFARQRTLAAIEELLLFAEARKERATTQDRQALWDKIVGNAKEMRTVLGEIATVIRSQFDMQDRNDVAQAQTQIATLDAIRDKFEELAEKSNEYSVQLAETAKIEIDEVYSDVRRTFIVALLLTLTAAAATMWLLHRSIVRPLFRLVALVERVGRGDLTQRVQDVGKDEFGRLGQHFNDMVTNLAEVALQTRTAAANMDAATSQLQASASQQAASAKEQGAAVQEITTTLGEISQSGAQISERAKAVANSAEATAEASRSGAEAVSEAALAMSSIGEQAEAVAENIIALTEKTRSVGDIIANVNDIAERSNLLALNAAIEASAAGEQGQSFAVVADEMKNLAHQAKEATKQVQGLLRDIQQGINTSVMQTEEAVKRTEVGKRQTDDMKQAIEGLVASVETSIQTFEQIVAATNQQQIGIEQVTQAIQDIRTSSGQVADGTRQLEGASANLNALSQQLQKSVQRYAV